MQNLEWYLADLKSTGKNTIETVEKSLTDMFIRLVRIYPCLIGLVLIWCRAGAVGSEPALNRHWACFSCLLGDQMTKKYRF